MDQLLLLEGPEKGSLYTVEDGIRIGRSSICEIQLSESRISRVHARLCIEEGTVYLEDEGSQNGVYLNGEEVERAALNAGDEIQIGSYVFVYNPEYRVQMSREGETLFIFDSESEEKSVQIRPAGQQQVQEEVLSDHERLKTLFRITQTLTRHMDRESLLDEFLEETVTGLRGDRGAILLREHPDEEPSIAASWVREETDDQMGMSQTVIEEVIRNQHAIVCPDATSDPRFESSASLEMEQVQSFLATPLQRNGDLLGMLYVDTLDVRRSFEEADLDLLENVAQQAGIALSNIREFEQTRKEVRRLRRKVSDEVTLVGDSPPMQHVMQTVRKVAPTTSTVLITGETGTGKELLARAIHHNSERRDGPFTAVDCSTISEQLIESELFGHVKGAFTGAEQARAGKFEAADGGTLFLDEIGNLNMKTQKKLLRFIEERTFTRVGDVKLRNVDVRIVAATNRDLEELVEEGAFREDLYYRLNVVPIELPPLRERKADIPDLVDHFLNRYAERNGTPKPEVEEDVIDELMERSWNGNVRQLRNVIERMIIMDEDDVLSPSDLPDDPRRSEPAPAGTDGDHIAVTGEGTLDESVQQLEEKRIREVLEETNGKKVDAAEKLGISRPTLDKKIEKYDIEVSDE